MCERADPADLLTWYDTNARTLPWRVPPEKSKVGTLPDPYSVWLSEIMLQQTGVVVVKDYFNRFMHLWPDVHTLAAADDARVMGEWAGLGYYARARNLLKCARVVAGELNGCFPDTPEALLRLPGIGPYTASAIGAIAFGRAETVVDGNVERVMARIFAVRAALPGCKPTLRAFAEDLTPRNRPGDYAQAVMDLGATVCTPKSPECGICPWKGACQARALEVAAELPKRNKKPAKPVRYGIAYLAQRADGAWLLERRPERGLLGGMLGWPGSEWAQEPTLSSPPIDADWRDPEFEVRHTFTHFHLRLSLRVAWIKTDGNQRYGDWIEAKEFRESDLPTVMRKAYRAAKNALD